MRISRHQFYTIANRKVHEQKIKEKKTAINLLISDFWSSDIIQRPPLLKGKEENFCHYHSLKNREKKERGRIWDGERRRPRAAALPPSPPPPLPLYWYMLGSTAAPQEKKQDLCYYVDAQCLILVKTIIICKHLILFFWSTSIEILHMEKIWRYWVASNFKWEIFSNFVAFSEYPNFTWRGGVSSVPFGVPFHLQPGLPVLF